MVCHRCKLLATPQLHPSIKFKDGLAKAETLTSLLDRLLDENDPTIDHTRHIRVTQFSYTEDSLLHSLTSALNRESLEAVIEMLGSCIPLSGYYFASLGWRLDFEIHLYIYIYCHNTYMYNN